MRDPLLPATFLLGYPLSQDTKAGLGLSVCEPLALFLGYTDHKVSSCPLTSNVLSFTSFMVVHERGSCLPGSLQLDGRHCSPHVPLPLSFGVWIGRGTKAHPPVQCVLSYLPVLGVNWVSLGSF